MYFYVNEVSEESTSDKRVIGLFTKCRYSASENYHSEYYHYTTLLAKYELHEKGIYLKAYEPKKEYTNYMECNKKYRKVRIGSMFWTKVIIAKSTKEAREIFKRQEWSDERVVANNLIERILEKVTHTKLFKRSKSYRWKNIRMLMIAGSFRQ